MKIQEAKINYLPRISVVIATFNSQATIARCLRSIRTQNYPQRLINIIIADGGSRDNTKEIVQHYQIEWIEIDAVKQNAEYNKSIGIQKAKGEILFLLDHDNILPHKNWLRRLVIPFRKHPEVVGVETLRYHYDPKTGLLDRYFALFGAGDPLAWYLGKADRLSFIYDHYHLFGEAKDYGEYYLVKFKVNEIPSLGANGFLIRRQLLMKHAQVAPGKFFHIDVNVDLIKQGFDTYAFVKDSVLHLTGYGNVWNFLKRRMLFMEQYHLSSSGLIRQSVRRYSIFEQRDLAKLIWFVLISLTVFIPLYDSFRGFRKIRDLAWFLHPLLCFSLVFLYGWVIIKHQTKFYVKRFLAK